jgi:16S rRNA (uracil1498-N3)-methyltransferase
MAAAMSNRCTFRAENASRAELQIVWPLIDIVESPVRLTLAQSLAKGDKFDLIVQKATELGCEPDNTADD